MPFDRRENPRESLAVCADLLQTPDHVLILFPEGTRTASSEIGEFKPGVGFLLMGTPIPVVPCYLDGAFRAWPKGVWIPRPRRLTLVIGDARTFADLPAAKESARLIANRLREAVDDLKRSIA
jgi:1-acyl-sn-glycerol-3-phosphate acyltransferase